MCLQEVLIRWSELTEGSHKTSLTIIVTGENNWLYASLTHRAESLSACHGSCAAQAALLAKCYKSSLVCSELFAQLDTKNRLYSAQCACANVLFRLASFRELEMRSSWNIKIPRSQKVFSCMEKLLSMLLRRAKESIQNLTNNTKKLKTNWSCTRCLKYFRSNEWN